MLSKTRAGLLKQLVSLCQDQRSVIQATGPARGLELAERDRHRGHAAVGAGAGAVVGYQFDFDVIAGSDCGTQLVKVLVHLVQI